MNQALESADDGVGDTQRTALGSWVSLFASSGTLVCCALPALLVTLGAGAALSSLVSVFPQIVWLSEHKAWVFGFAAAMMAFAGYLQWRNRTAPCPIDPKLRDACLRTRKNSFRIYLASLAMLAIGGWFAFVMPWLNA
jgi:Na+/melibiose symporter-like transporter